MDTDAKVKNAKLRLENFDRTNFGYLLVAADAKQLKISYNPVTTHGTLLGLIAMPFGGEHSPKPACTSLAKPSVV
jgi:hypothetical protein